MASDQAAENVKEIGELGDSEITGTPRPQSPNSPISQPFDRRDAALLITLCLLAIIALWPILAAGPGLAPGLPGHDAETQWRPWREFGFGAMRQGVIAFWNPYVLCGTPFVGDFQSALFYPPNLLFLIFPLVWAARLSLLLHLWMSLIFAYLFGRAFTRTRAAAAVTALVYTFGAAQLLRVPAGHWGVSCAIPWLPLILLCVEMNLRGPSRRALAVGALAIGMQALSGVPQYVFITGIAAVIWALLRAFSDPLPMRERARRWLSVAGMFFLGAAVAAVQIGPGMEAVLGGARSLPMRAEWAAQFSLGPESLLTMLSPNLFGGMSRDPYWGRYFFWEMNAYVGAAALALALCAFIAARPRRQVAWFGLLAGVMLLLALGRHTPLWHVMRALPLSGMFRGSAKFLLPASLALAALAGMGLDAVAPDNDRRRAPMGWIAAGLILASLAAMALAPSLMKTVKPESFFAGWANLPAYDVMLNALIGGFMPILCLAVLGGIAVGFRAHRQAVLWGVVIIVAVDLLCFARGFIGPWATFRAESPWPPGAAEALRRDGGMSRVLASGRPELNEGMAQGVPTVEGIEPNPPARFHLLFCKSQGRPVDIAPSVYQLARPEHAAQLFALGLVLQPGGVIVRIPDALPRAFVMTSARAVTDTAEAFDLALQEDLRRTVILESFPAGQIGPPAALLPARITRESPNQIAIEATAPAASGWLVLMDNNFPGWTAQVDGQSADIIPANFAFRAVPIPSGTHAVTFTYRPNTFNAGIGVTLCGLALCVISIARRRGCR